MQDLLKTLPGFVEGFLYEKVDVEGRPNFMTTAVWESEAAFENAKAAAVAELRRLGFHPPETRAKLKIESERGVFHRVRY